jgi:hypothetical protein
VDDAAKLMSDMSRGQVVGAGLWKVFQEWIKESLFN